MHHSGICRALLLALLSVSPLVLAGPVTLDFEGLPDSTILTTQLPGLTFTNAIVLTAGIGLNEFEFPPHSGVNVVSDDGAPLAIAFSTQVVSFGGYFTHLVPLTLQAFDGGGHQVGSATSAFSNNLACLAGPPCAGDPGSPPNEWISLAFTSGVSRLIITGDPAGSSFTLDDAVYAPLGTAPVPEPSSISLFIGGLILFLALSARRTIRKPMLTTHRTLFSCLLLGIALLLAGRLWLYAHPLSEPSPQQAMSSPLTLATLQPTITTVAATPNVIPANSPTAVMLTSQITDDSLVPGSVNLLRINPDGSSLILAQLSDDGKNGDALAGDHVFTAQAVLNEPAQTQLRFQVSAAFRGLLKRVASPIVTVYVFNPDGVSAVDLAARNTVAVLGRVLSIQSFETTSTPSSWPDLKNIETDITIAPQRFYKGTASSSSVTLRVPGGTVGRRTQASLGVPSFTEGEVVFVLAKPSANGYYSITDGALAVFHVHDGKAIIDPAYASSENTEQLNQTLKTFISNSAAGLTSLDDVVSVMGV